MAEKIAPKPKTILYNTISWSPQQISGAIQAGNKGYASVRFLPDSPDTIEITTADFSIFFEAFSYILAVKPASSLKQADTVPNISHPIPVTEVVPSRSLDPENTALDISHPISVTGTIMNKGELFRRVGRIFDFAAMRRRLNGTIRPQRQI